MDTIFIKDLSVRGKHGVYDEERTREQEFLIDIAMDVDTRKAGESDDIEDTVNYGGVRKIAKDIVEDLSFRLLEKMAHTIATEALKDIRIKRISVTVRKTEMYGDCTPGVTVIREQV
ncbi:MAG: dihydroneopterin aldolase [Candidatus Paceibacterota bacterium]